MGVLSSASIFEDAWLDGAGNGLLADWVFKFLTSVRVRAVHPATVMMAARELAW